MILAPTPFIPVPSSTLIHPRDTVSGKVAAGATVSITMPSNGSSDIVVGIIGHNTSDTTNVGTPAGFTVVTTGGFGSSFPAMKLFYCVNPGTSVSYTNPSSNLDEAYIFRTYQLVDIASPLSGSASTSDTIDGNPNSPSITTSHNNALVISAGVTRNTDNTSCTAPSGYSNLTVQAATDPTSSQTCCVMMADKILSTAGAENPGAFTTAASAFTYAGTMALKPA